MPVQEAMIARLRDLCLQDERVVAALLYGSFARGEGDAFSDIDAALFVVDDALRTLNQQAWVQQIAPVALYFDDDFGHHTAIFTNFIRGEFHFEPASAMATIESWRGNAWFPNLDVAWVACGSSGSTALLHSPTRSRTEEFARVGGMQHA